MTLMLLNAQALCNLHMGKFEEAERMLQESLSKNANGRSRPTSTGHAHAWLSRSITARALVLLADVTTLANLVVCMQQLRKPPDVVSRYINQLKAVAPTHLYCQRYAELEASFVAR